MKKLSKILVVLLAASLLLCLFAVIASANENDELNVYFYETINEYYADAEYEEYEGAHDWAFWDTYIQKVLAWMFD